MGEVGHHTALPLHFQQTTRAVLNAPRPGPWLECLTGNSRRPEKAHTHAPRPHLGWGVNLTGHDECDRGRHTPQLSSYDNVRGCRSISRASPVCARVLETTWGFPCRPAPPEARFCQTKRHRATPQRAHRKGGCAKFSFFEGGSSKEKRRPTCPPFSVREVKSGRRQILLRAKHSKPRQGKARHRPDRPKPSPKSPAPPTGTPVLFGTGACDRSATCDGCL